MANAQIVALDAVLGPDQHAGSRLQAPAGRASSKQGGQAVALENVAEPEFRIAAHPAVTLSHMSSRVDADKVIGAVVAPNAKQVLAPVVEGIQKLVERAKPHPMSEPPVHPVTGELN
jgi:hypothetical protein